MNFAEVSYLESVRVSFYREIDHSDDSVFDFQMNCIDELMLHAYFFFAQFYHLCCVKIIRFIFQIHFFIRNRIC